jgi:hypothetical protein
VSDEQNKPQPQEQAAPPDAQPAPDQATTPLASEGRLDPDQPVPGEQAQTAQSAAEPAAQANQTAESGAAAPPPPPPPAPPYQQPAQPGGFGRFVRHRATQIVAAGIAGLLIGGAGVALISHGGGHDRPGFYYRGDGRGPGGGFGPYRDGPGYRDGGPRQLPPRQRPAPPSATPQTPPSGTTTAPSGTPTPG